MQLCQAMLHPGSNRVLVVEDEKASREALVMLLEFEGYDVRSASGGDEAITLIADWAPDLIVSDVSMPRGHGFGLVSALREREDCKDTAILLVSARDDIDRRVHGLDIGADDFLSKPVNPEELLARIRAHLRNTDRRRQLHQGVVTDPTTCLLNRRGLGDAVGSEMARASRGAAFSVLVFDLDHFKAINDNHGHGVGDEVLEHVARAIQSTARSIDHCGRWGGDEFVVVLSGCDSAAASIARERYQRAIEGELVVKNGTLVSINCSVGRATYRDGHTFESLLAEADASMYENKKQRHEHAATLPLA